MLVNYATLEKVMKGLYIGEFSPNLDLHLIVFSYFKAQ